MKAWLVGVLLLLGLGVRLAVLPLPGCNDMSFYKSQCTAAVKLGLSRTYGPSDQAIRAQGWTQAYAQHARLPVTEKYFYPPVSTYLYKIAGEAYRRFSPDLADGPGFNLALNFFPWLSSCLILILLWRWGGARLALLYWLNPALLLFSALGLQDYTYTLLALASLVALYHKKYGASLMLIILSTFTKPQGLILGLLVLGVLLLEARHRLLPLLGLGAATVMVIILPYAASGQILSLGFQIKDYLSYQDLSGFNPNIWWLLTFAKNLQLALAQGFSWPQALALNNIMVSSFQFSPLLAAVLPFLGYALLLTWLGLNFAWLAARLPRERTALFWAGVLQVYGYNVLHIGVQENYFLPALLLCLFCWRLPLSRMTYIALSLIYGGALYLRNGLGLHMPAPGVELLRHALWVDSSLWLALLNLVWFGYVVFQSWSSRGGNCDA